MPQSFAAVHVHIVFSTKNREPHITPDLAPRLYEYLGGIARGNGCSMRTAGGIADHVHLLVSLGRTISIADLVKVLKSGSSRWVHETFGDRAGFAWQSGYGAFSVSEAQIEIVSAYIDNQEAHHARRSFQDEYRELLRNHGFEWDERYVWD